MRRWVLSFALAAIVGLCTASWAKADGIDNFQYVFDGNTYTWQLPASPNPPDVVVPLGGSDGFFEMDSISYKLNGVTQTPLGIFDFFTAGAQGGGFELSLATNDIILNTFNPQLFSGDINSPTFIPTFILGKFKLANGDPLGPTGTLTISSATVTEPASLALLGVGLLTIAGIVRRKRAAQQN